MKKILIFIFIIVFIGIGYWFFIQKNRKNEPNNLPTADEIKRMREIEESSSQKAPNAVPGAGVRPVGSLPKPPEQTLPPQSTTTESTTTSEVN